MVFTIDIKKEDLEHYNKLLSLDLDEDLGLYGAKEDDYIGLYYIDLGDNYGLSIDLASGKSNYYDNVVLYKNNEEFCVYDCEFELGNDYEIDLDNGKKCIVKWNIIQ